MTPDTRQPIVVAELPWDEAWLLAGRLKAEGIAARVFPETKAARRIVDQIERT